MKEKKLKKETEKAMKTAKLLRVVVVSPDGSQETFELGEERNFALCESLTPFTDKVGIHPQQNTVTIWKRN